MRKQIDYILLIYGLGICQALENLALYKPAYQTGGWESDIANLSVDGNPWPCAQPYNADRVTPARWWVDLGDVYNIWTITISNSDKEGQYFRLTNFTLSVGRTLDSLVQCGSTPYTDTPVLGGTVVIHFCANYKGRWLQFERVGGPEQYVVALCEVQVTGERKIDCSKCPQGTACNIRDGCSQCAVGYYGADCTQVCSGTYGVNCSQPCGRCSVSPCRPVDGECTQGCQRWWAGATCTQEIVQPNWQNETSSVGRIMDTSIELSWEQINISPSLSVFYGYKLFYKAETENNFVNGDSVKHKNLSETNSGVISNLTFNTRYEIWIEPYRVFDGVGKFFGFPYPKHSVKTLCKAPQNPLVKVAMPEQNDTFKITWDPVSSLASGCDNISSIRVEYKLSRDSRWTQEKVSHTSTHHTVAPPGGGEYDVRVMVVNNEGREATSSLHKITIEGPVTTSSEATTTTMPPTTTTTSSSVTQGSKQGLDQTTVTIIAAVVVGVIIVALTILLIVVLIRKRRQKNDKAEEISSPPIQDITIMGTSTSNANIPLTKEVAGIIKKKGEYPGTTNSESLVLNHKPSPKLHTAKPNKAKSFSHDAVPVSDLEAYTKQKHANPSVFADEFKKLPKENLSRCKLAVTDENKALNRFKNIYAYDEKRVPLVTSDIYESDYINASYIDGYSKEREYIATQGVINKTIVDLYRMIWQEGSNRVVMVSNLVENTKRRCEQYWPQTVGGTELFSDFSVTLEAEVVSADHTQRTINLCKQSESRTIHQFHFTTWEDKNKPVYGAVTLFAFYKKLHTFDSLSTGPLIVHCSAGVGRTGTFIAFDILLNQARAEGQVDIIGWVTRLRKQRMFMVQTKGQYIFLHDALVEYLASGDTSYQCNDFNTKYQSLINPKPELGGISELEKQFNVLESLKPSVDTAQLAGNNDENRDKNRDLSILPDDSKRPFLSTHHPPGNDYINAVYVPSYKARGHYVATQMPLPNTISDFWRLVHEHNCHTIVMLNAITTEDPTCPPYWPDEDEPTQRYGPLEVELVKVTADSSAPSVVTRDFRVRVCTDKPPTDPDKDVQKVRQFQLLSWEAGDVLPGDSRDLLGLMDMVQNWQQQQGLRPGAKARMLVHCMDGASRCGMYCGVSHTLDRMRIEQEIDAFLAARYVTLSRPHFIRTLAEYSFLYEMALSSMSRFKEFANFH